MILAPLFYRLLIGLFAALVIASSWLFIKKLSKGEKATKTIAATTFFFALLVVLATIGRPEGIEYRMKPKGNAVVMDVDFSKDEYAPRVQISGIDGYKGYCASGSGGTFSNKPGSHCSSLGLYKVARKKKMSNGCDALVLDGLSDSNSNARYRGILIHGSKLVNGWRHGIKKKKDKTSEGCFAVDSKTLKKIMTLHQRGITVFVWAHK